MKMVLVRLKIIILKSNIAVLVMIMVFMRMKYGWMGIDFMQQCRVILVMVEKLHKVHHQITLHDG